MWAQDNSLMQCKTSPKPQSGWSQMPVNGELKVELEQVTSSSPSPLFTDTRIAPLGPILWYLAISKWPLLPSSAMKTTGDSCKRSHLETTSSQRWSLNLSLISLYITNCKSNNQQQMKNYIIWGNTHHKTNHNWEFLVWKRKLKS